MRAPEVLIGCRDCGAIQRMQPPQRGSVACWRCGRVLEDRTGRSLDAGLALSVATFLLLLPTNLAPLMTVHVAGTTVSTHLVSGLALAWRQSWGILAVVLALAGVMLPLLRFGLLSLTLAAVRLGRQGRRTGVAFRWCEQLDPWAMSDVLLIGAGIGYGRIASSVPVTIDFGGWCLVGAALGTMLTRAALDPQEVWRRLQPHRADWGQSDPGVGWSGLPPFSVPARSLACTSCGLVLPAEADGGHCPRCRAGLHRRRPDSPAKTAALLLATVLLTPFAYLLPMSSLWEIGTPHPHSIINGIVLLFEHSFWYFGLIIFVLSLAFPLTKIVVLSWCLLSIRGHSVSRLRTKTRLYRFVDGAGRWSMLDPFTVFVFAPMAQFEQLAHINFMAGSVVFLATVVFSMRAAHELDARLMWDATAKSA